MSESPKQQSVEKIPANEAFLIRAAQDPVEILQHPTNAGKTVAEKIAWLRAVRSHISTTKVVIKNPDAHFALFYRQSDGVVDHYVGLFSILREAGATQLDIQLALHENLPARRTGVSDSDRGAVVQWYLSITEAALDQVFIDATE